MPGVDGGFGAVECICVIDRELCAEDFCGTREDLGGREGLDRDSLVENMDGYNCNGRESNRMKRNKIHTLTSMLEPIATSKRHSELAWSS